MLTGGKAKKLKKRSTSPLACQIQQHTVALPTFPYAVLPSHHTGVTKFEQHEKFVNYDTKVVHFVPDKLHTFEKQHQLSSESLSTLNQLFYKFQQYRLLFDEVIKSSGLYGEALQEIKTMYDSYVADHIENLTEESQQSTCLYQSSDIEKMRIRVGRLENDVTTLIAENAQLQNVLKEETESYSSAKALLEAPVVALPHDTTEPVEFSDKVEDLQLQIVKQRQLTQSYLNQRVGKVPISVVRNLEHALKETEISIQKLDKHNSYLETRIQVCVLAVYYS